MASKDLGTAAPHLKKKDSCCTQKAITITTNVIKSKGISTTIHGCQEVVKKKVVKRVQDTDRAWFGTQKGGNLRTRRKPVNRLPTLYQYYQ
jgi:aminopeptidase C